MIFAAAPDRRQRTASVFSCLVLIGNDILDVKHFDQAEPCNY
jgi:hypothetical protein